MALHRFNPDMLILAREYRGLNQTGLARLTPYDQSVISRFENGVIALAEEAVRVFSRALDFPVGFFEQTDKIYGLGCSFLFHRKRQTMPVLALRQVAAEVNVTRLRISRMLRGVEPEHEYEIVPKEPGVDGTPEQVAALVRASWRIRSGPIVNLTGAVESAGGMVIHCLFTNRKVDGISMWVTGDPPMFFLNEAAPGDRDRWTLAHELGHIIMHRNARPEIEDEADRFAAEFLMPAKDIRPELQNMTLARAAALKLKWRVSMIAIIRRAKQLEMLGHNQYRYLCMEMSRNGWKLREPNEIPRESANSLKALIEFHRCENGYDIDGLGRLANASPRDLQERTIPRSEPRLRIVL
jgi:Zn-dependent peptidase ImmA (M78 family)